MMRLERREAGVREGWTDEEEDKRTQDKEREEGKDDMWRARKTNTNSK